VKWKNHRRLGFALTFLAGQPITTCLLAGVASVIPDAIEFGGMKHRGFSHSVVLWSVLTVLGFMFLPVVAISDDMIPAMLYPYIKNSLLNPVLDLRFIPAGGLFHLIGDAMTPSGVPLFGYEEKKKQRIALGLFYTGDTMENIFTLFVLGICILGRILLEIYVW